MSDLKLKIIETHADLAGVDNLASFEAYNVVAVPHRSYPQLTRDGAAYLVMAPHSEAPDTLTGYELAICVELLTESLGMAAEMFRLQLSALDRRIAPPPHYSELAERWGLSE